jgi:hypothetical protein
MCRTNRPTLQTKVMSEPPSGDNAPLPDIVPLSIGRKGRKPLKVKVPNESGSRLVCAVLMLI